MSRVFQKDWKSFKIKYTFKETVYHIEIHQEEEENDNAVALIVDDVLQQEAILQLKDDKTDHHVILKINMESGVDAEQEATSTVNNV